jgi:hypothetical protein
MNWGGQSVSRWATVIACQSWRPWDQGLVIPGLAGRRHQECDVVTNWTCPPPTYSPSRSGKGGMAGSNCPCVLFSCLLWPETLPSPTVTLRSNFLSPLSEQQSLLIAWVLLSELLDPRTPLSWTPCALRGFLLGLSYQADLLPPAVLWDLHGLAWSGCSPLPRLHRPWTGLWTWTMFKVDADLSSPYKSMPCLLATCKLRSQLPRKTSTASPNLFNGCPLS